MEIKNSILKTLAKQCIERFEFEIEKKKLKKKKKKFETQAGSMRTAHMFEIQGGVFEEDP